MAVMLLVLLAPLCTMGQGAETIPAERLASFETDEARAALRDQVLEAEIWRVRGMKVSPVYQRTYGTTALVSTGERGGSLSITVAVSTPGAPKGRTRGTFTLYRNSEDGEATRFRIATRDEPGCFFEVTRSGDRAAMDVYLLGGPDPLYRGVIVPVPFEELLTSPLKRIIDLTSAKVDWPFVFYEGARSEDALVEELGRSIRGLLPGLRDADDGAIDEDGRFVFISTLKEQPRPGGLNCSGFVKWIVDGFYYPLRGRNTSVAKAKLGDETLRSSPLARAMEAEEPYFGLDWTRNLAAMLDEARRGGEAARRGEAFDVRSTETAVYVEDVGYPVGVLERLLYRETMTHPGSFYLGSLNDAIGPNGLRQHFHTVALLPYFDDGGVFRVRVFERIRESSLAGLSKRYPSAYMHLVRIATEGRFAPLGLP